MLPALAAYGLQTVGRAILPSVTAMGSQFAAGKMGETIGGHNEQESQGFRDRNDQRNIDGTNRQNTTNAQTTNQAGSQGQQLSREDAVFGNQLAQSNNRANTALNMAVYDQDNAFKNGQQLASNYTNTANQQAATSANLMASILGNQMGGARR